MKRRKERGDDERKRKAGPKKWEMEVKDEKRKRVDEKEELRMKNRKWELSKKKKESKKRKAVLEGKERK